MNAHTHTSHTCIRAMRLKKRFLKRRKVFKEDLEELKCDVIRDVNYANQCGGAIWNVAVQYGVVLLCDARCGVI